MMHIQIPKAETQLQPLFRRFIALGLYAVAMAYLESAVVVYLRMLYYPEGFTVLLKPMPLSVYYIELGRETATIVMLIVVARLAFRPFWLRFSAFMYLFAIWDIMYYLWLILFIHWPPSLGTWDILFLIPIAWVGPVWSPVLVSLNLLLASIVLNRLYITGKEPTPKTWHWGCAIFGAALILYSYFNKVPALLTGHLPSTYSWPYLIVGLIVGWSALILSIPRTLHDRSKE